MRNGHATFVGAMAIEVVALPGMVDRNDVTSRLTGVCEMLCLTEGFAAVWVTGVVADAFCVLAAAGELEIPAEQARTVLAWIREAAQRQHEGRAPYRWL